MKYYKLRIGFIVCVGLVSQNSFCDTSNLMSSTQQVGDALNQWFGKRTLITSGALIGSALLGMALYKVMTQCIIHYLFPQAKQLEENVNVQEIPYDVIEQLRLTNWDPNKIRELRQNSTYKDYLDEVLTDHYYNELRVPVSTEKLLRPPLKNHLELQKKKFEKILNLSNWNRQTIKDLRETYPNNQALDELLIGDYYQTIYNTLQSIPKNERLQWVENCKDFLIRIPEENRPISPLITLTPDRLFIKSISDGSERGMLGAKYRSLKKLEEDTNNFTDF